MIVTTTPLALFLFALILFLGPVRGLWVLFVVMPLGAAAAINPAGRSIILMDFNILAIWASLLFYRISFAQLLGSARPGRPGFPLLLLVIVVTIGAVFLPRVMAGSTEVYVTMRFADGAENVLIPLRPVGSNINQLLRFIIAASVFFALASVFAKVGDTGPVRRAMIIATSVNIVMVGLDLGSYAVGMPNLLDVIRTGNFAMLDAQAFFGIKRISGGYPEPSAFSDYTAGLMGYWVRDWFGSRRSRFSTFFFVVTLLIMLRTLSSSAYVTMVIFMALFLTWHVSAIVRRKRAFFLYYILVLGIPLGIGFLILAWNFIPVLSDLVDTLLVGKLTSSSGTERMEWNAQAITNFFETYGMGAGIGSVRASGWFVSLLGSLGAVGTALFVWFLLAALARKSKRPGSDQAEVAGALIAGCVAMLVQSSLIRPYPNPGVSFFAMAGLAAGLLRYDARLAIADARDKLRARHEEHRKKVDEHRDARQTVRDRAKQEGHH